MTITIGNREIGPEYQPLVVCEIGLSHMGDVDRAIEYVRKAHSVGCEAIKMQYHIPHQEMVEGHPWWDTIRDCELEHDEHHMVRDQVRRLGMLYGCTPFCEEAVACIEELDPDYYKIGGAGWQHEPMLQAIGETGRPSMMSLGCGARLSDDIAASRINPLPLHCVSAYPSEPELWDLTRIMDIGARVVGLSDHSGAIFAGIAAVALGASVVEVHCPRTGPDASASIGFAELAELIRGTREVWQGMRMPQRRGDDPEVVRLASHDPYAGWRRVG